MTNVAKVTISLPVELLERIEAHRHERGMSRSEVMVDLMWQGWRQAELGHREEQHRQAYALEADSSEELGWADMAADELFGPSKKKRRAAG